MSNVLLIFVFYLQTSLIEIAVAQTIRTDCSFLSTIYSSESAVENQFQLNNATSISLAASYAFTSSRFISRFELGLIYQYPSNDYLVPFPIRFNCTSIIHSCQLRSMTSSNLPSINSEPIRVQLTSINYTTVRTSLQWQQMGLYLKQGRYQLSNCTLDDEQTITHPRTLFFIDIQYEKSIGKSCWSQWTLNPQTIHWIRESLQPDKDQISLTIMICLRKGFQLDFIDLDMMIIIMIVMISFSFFRKFV